MNTNNHSLSKASLYTRTLSLLEMTEIPTREISEGADVQLRWLQLLKAGSYKDPGVNKVERVHDYLAGKVGKEA